MRNKDNLLKPKPKGREIKALISSAITNALVKNIKLFLKNVFPLSFKCFSFARTKTITCNTSRAIGTI